MSQQEPNVEPEAFDTARAEVEIAFTDITDVTDRDARCLSFLSSVWVTPRDAARLTGIIGEYNGFDPLYMSEEGVWEEIADADPTARCAVGREGSPVVYIETERPDEVSAILAGLSGRGTFPPTPDELAKTEHVGTASRSYYGSGEDQRDPHSMCKHDSPVVPVSDYPQPRDGAAVVRAWWD
jgi:hypothetical protein